MTKHNEIEHPKLNGGKPFVVPDWTYKKHLEVQKVLAGVEDKIDEEDRDILFQNTLIKTSLKDIVKPEITDDTLENLHPNDRVELYMKCYLAGRKGFNGEKKKDFRKKNQTSKKSNQSQAK